MPRGRPPKPTHLHLINGNPSKIPDLEARMEREPQPEKITAENVPKPPSHLPPKAKKCWVENAANLAAVGLLTQVDLGMLEVYCAHYAVYMTCQADIKRHKAVVYERETKYGSEETALPQVRMMQQAQHGMLEVAREFGMTPSARGRLVVPGQTSAEDEMERLLRQGG